MYEIHSSPYEEALSIPEYGNLNTTRGNGQPTYEELNDNLKQNMSPKAWVIYEKMCKCRADGMGKLQISISLEGWVCKNRRQGILEVNWTRLNAEASWKYYNRNRDDKSWTGVKTQCENGTSNEVQVRGLPI